MVDLIKLSTNIEEMAEYQPLPRGPYMAELREAEIRHSEKVPNGYIYAVFRIDPADFPADYDASNAPEGMNVVYANVKLPDPDNRRTVAPFKAFLRALGQNVSGDTFDPSTWIGSQAKIMLSVNEYQGALVNNIDSVMAASNV